MYPIKPKKITREENFQFEFSICTLVTRLSEYEEMLGSFYNAGFTDERCEFMYIDNSTENVYDGYAGLNKFLREARGKYIILCHQDILLRDHKITDLRKRMSEVEKADPKWAILANAGGINFKYTAMHLIQGSGEILHEELLPLKAINVDENFMVVKSEANLALSADLHGFHFYGTDICLIADILGYTIYVIDFKIIHKSDGTADKSFYKVRNMLQKKYSHAFRSRFIGTTMTRFYVSGNKLKLLLYNIGFIKFFVRQYYKLFCKRLYVLKEI